MDLSTALEEEELVTGSASPWGTAFGSLLDVTSISPSLHQAKQSVPVTSRIAPVMVTPWRNEAVAILKAEAYSSAYEIFYKEMGLMACLMLG